MKEGLIGQTKKLSPLRWIPSSKYILIAILILGFVLRVYKITSLPMYGDELTIVYDAYSILRTGMDQTGEPFPLTFKMGAGRPGGYVYGTIPFVAIFGLNEWGVRGLSVLSGLGIILLMYFLSKKLFGREVGLWASFLTSISMWDIYLSRGGFEAHFGLLLALLGVVLFLHQKFIPMALAFGIAVFTYPTFKLTVPLVILVLMFFLGFKKLIQKKSYIVALLILIVFAGFSFRETTKGISDQRFSNLNIFSNKDLNENIVQRINEQRNLTNLPSHLTNLLYNKPVWYSRILLENYIENLSPQFLFLRGDGNPRTNPGEWGMLYLADAILLVVGLYHLAKNERRNLSLLILWIVIIPLATMLLSQTHALRNNFMLPPFLLISAYAFTKINKNMKALVFIIILIQLIYVLVTIYFYAPNKFGSFWSEEAKILSLKTIEQSKFIDVTLITKIDNIEYAYPVYAKIDPNKVISQYGKFPKVYGNVTISNE